MNTIYLKFVLIGDSNVGKSTFISKYVKGITPKQRELTIGVDFAIKEFIIDDKKFKLNIWDTAGQETFRAITRSYYRGCHCAIIFFDISNKQSYNNASVWADTYLEYGKPNLLFIGNKYDKIRQVTREQGNLLANKYQSKYIEISMNYFNESFVDNELIKFITNINPLYYKEYLQKIDIEDQPPKIDLCGLCKIQ